MQQGSIVMNYYRKSNVKLPQMVASNFIAKGKVNIFVALVILSMRPLVGEVTVSSLP